MLTTIITILPVFLIIAAGFGVGRAGLLGPDAPRALNRFVIWLALPALLFDVVAVTDWQRFWDPAYVYVSIIGSVAVFAAGLLVGRWRGLGLADMAVDGLNASYLNAAFVGLPLLLIILGPASRPYVVVAATLTSMTLFALGVILIELGHSHGAGIGHAIKRTVMGIVRNPVLMGPALGLAFWTAGIPLPTPVERFVSMLGAAASPTALVSIGLFLSQRPLTPALSDRFAITLTALKLIGHPLATALLAWYVFPLPHDVALTAILVAGLSTGTGPFMIAEFYAKDGRVTSATILLSTICSIVTLAAILSWFGSGA